MTSTLTASRYSWCLVVEHLYEAVWDSFRETGGAGVNPSLRVALDEIVKVECVADMLSELSTDVDVIVKMQKQVRSIILQSSECTFSPPITET